MQEKTDLFLLRTDRPCYHHCKTESGIFQEDFYQKVTNGNRKIKIAQ